MNKKIITLGMVLACIFLGSCSGAQSDWFFASADVWLNINGIAVQEGLEVDLDKLVGFLIDQAVDEYTNSEEANALDAARGTLADIEQADQYLEQAFTSSTVSELAGKSIDEIKKAQELRPDDITYHEAEVAIWMVNGNEAAAQSAMDKSDKMVIESIDQGMDCKSALLNQMRIRREMLIRQLDNPSVENDIVTKDNINQMIGKVDDQILRNNSLEGDWYCHDIEDGKY